MLQPVHLTTEKIKYIPTQLDLNQMFPPILRPSIMKRDTREDTYMEKLEASNIDKENQGNKNGASSNL